MSFSSPSSLSSLAVVVVVDIVFKSGRGNHSRNNNSSFEGMARTGSVVVVAFVDNSMTCSGILVVIVASTLLFLMATAATESMELPLVGAASSVIAEAGGGDGDGSN